MRKEDIDGVAREESHFEVFDEKDEAETIYKIALAKGEIIRLKNICKNSSGSVGLWKSGIQP